MQDASALGAFFRPNSVAVVGASSDPKKLGHTVLKNLISMGFRGKIFPINPREDTILGLRCWRSLLDVPEPVEVCALIVAADLTLQVAAQMVERKKRWNDVLGAICMSAGFAELPNGEDRQRELVAILRSASIRLIGPNCLGIIDTCSGFNTNFDISTYPRGGLSIPIFLPELQETWPPTGNSGAKPQRRRQKSADEPAQTSVLSKLAHWKQRVH